VGVCVFGGGGYVCVYVCKRVCVWEKRVLQRAVHCQLSVCGRGGGLLVCVYVRVCLRVCDLLPPGVAPSDGGHELAHVGLSFMIVPHSCYYPVRLLPVFDDEQEALTVLLPTLLPTMCPSPLLPAYAAPCCSTLSKSLLRVLSHIAFPHRGIITLQPSAACRCCSLCLTTSKSLPRCSYTLCSLTED